MDITDIKRAIRGENNKPMDIQNFRWVSARKAVLLGYFFFLSVVGFSQSLPVGLPAAEDFLRRAQLLGQFDSTVSFGARPLSSLGALDTTYEKMTGVAREGLKGFAVGKDSVFLLPVTLSNQFNSHHPTGWNDGSLLPNKGLQTRISAGAYVRHNKWSLQLMPELTFSQNDTFVEFTDDHFPVIWLRTYRWWNTIDAPVRFGEESLFRLHPGQSALRYDLGRFSAGLSSENLWWGPGKRNSLIMSNNTPGFYHLTFNTNGPLMTKAGSFEGQFVAGRLTRSGFTPPETDRDYQRTQLYFPKRDDWRYLSGLTVSWQPLWVPGLFLGFSQTSQVYAKEIASIRDIQPFFNGIRQAGIEPNPKLTSNQQQSSGYLRWLLKESNAEFYIEFGTNGRSRGLREFLVQANRHRAFTMGVSKIYETRKKRFVQIDAEVTQLGQVVREVIRDADSWYVDKYIRQGYTHQGQVLGAGIGPGSNIMYLEVSVWKGMKKVGIFAERLVHNNDFFYFAYEDSKDWRRFWTDLSTGIVADWRFDQLVLSSTLRYTRSWNYQWYLERGPDDPYFVKGWDVNNIHATVNLAYFFR